MQIVIVGDGKVGLTLTQMLSAEDHNITVVDSNAKVLAGLHEDYDVRTVLGHGATRVVLEEAEAGEAQLLIAATSSDEINLLSCLTAKKLGCEHTIARVRNPEYFDQINFLREDLGLSFAINPDKACAREIFQLLQFPSFLERERFVNGRVEIVCINIDAHSPFKGISLQNLYQAAKVRVLVCAVERDGEVIIPDGSFSIREGDDLYISSSSENLAALIKNLKLMTRKVTQVTIVGGSRLGLYLANRLLRSGVHVKIIEKNPEKCIRLADLLPDADIIEADGTDQNVLHSEGALRSDALVALTGFDEGNIILSIYAHQNGVRKVITKCNNMQYGEMFRKMGIDTFVSPKMTSASEIVSYVRAMEASSGSRMMTMHYIVGGKAEALEFIAHSSSKLLGIPLADLPLRKGVLIACITRGTNVTIPTGGSTIQVGDSVMIVTAAGRIYYDLDEILDA